MYVYFVRSDSEPARVKVGKAFNVKGRVSSLQTGNPHRLEILGSVLCWTDAAALEFEAKVHKELEAHRIVGEWFALTPEVESRITALMQTKFEKPQARRKRGPKPRPSIVTEGLISIASAAQRYGIDQKRLRGYIWRNDLMDPIGALGADMVYDDWRLQRLAVAR